MFNGSKINLEVSLTLTDIITLMLASKAINYILTMKINKETK